MSSVQLLDQLQVELAKVAGAAQDRAEREPIPTGETESAWLTHVQHLKDRRQDLLTSQQKAARLVEATEADLAELESALRLWLDTAAGLKSKPGVDQRR